MNTPNLKLFSDPHFLRLVGRPLLTKLFEHFTHILPYKHFLPNPCADNDSYFDSLAQVLERTNDLPAALAQALREVESLAEANNCVENGEAPSLSHAIQSWLGAHSARQASPSSSGGEDRGEETPVYPTPSIENPENSNRPESPSSSAYPES